MFTYWVQSAADRQLGETSGVPLGVEEVDDLDDVDLNDENLPRIDLELGNDVVKLQLPSSSVENVKSDESKASTRYVL